MLLPPGTRVARWAALFTPLILPGVLAPAAMADAPPRADFGMTVNGRSVTAVKPGTTVRFTDRSTDSDGGIVQRGWDVNGDGVITDPTGPATLSRHFGGPPRAYTILLRVTDNAGNTAEARKTLTVVAPGQEQPQPQPEPQPPPPPAANRAPVSAFTFAPASPRVGEPVTFTSAARDPDGALVAYAWDLDGDGQYDDGTGATAEATFTSPGNRTVALRVADNKLAVNVAFRTLTVQPAAPTDAATPAPAIASPGIAVLPIGAVRPQLHQPELTVRIRGKILPTTVRVLGLSVKAPTGFKARVWCVGRGCPFSKAVRRVRNGFARFAQLQRTLRPGTIIRVTVTKRDNWGRYTSLRLRRGAAPDRKDRCLRGESTHPLPCPPPA